MSRSCLQMSMHRNVLAITKFCNCSGPLGSKRLQARLQQIDRTKSIPEYTSTKHSIHSNVWISSNKKNIHRWHVSLPNTSKCKIGIVSNVPNEKYLFEYKGLSKDSISESSIITISLTLDLSNNAAVLYYFQNGNISSRNVICNNIVKENNTKYQFIIEEFNSLSSVSEMHVCAETI
eukprot:524910_1